jgi:hypothetical protein
MNYIKYILCVEISGSKIHYLKCNNRTTIKAIIVIKRGRGVAREYYANSSCDRHVANILMKANVFSYNATFVTVHRCNSAEADLSANAAITLHLTSSLVTACFERKG